MIRAGDLVTVVQDCSGFTGSSSGPPGVTRLGNSNKIRISMLDWTVVHVPAGTVSLVLSPPVPVGDGETDMVEIALEGGRAWVDTFYVDVIDPDPPVAASAAAARR